jgi:hypothetical protein
MLEPDAVAVATAPAIKIIVKAAARRIRCESLLDTDRLM